MKNKIGNKYGRLKVISRKGSDKYNNSIWECICDCGNLKTVPSHYLVTGRTKSCGCIRNERLIEMANNHKTHGMSKTKIYKTWVSMIERCTNKNHGSYKDYGGRGITICKEWENFEIFYSDMSDCPDGLSLDRKDNNKGYSKNNCHWATSEEQCQNKRNTKMNPIAVRCVRYLYKKGIKITELANAYNINYSTMEAIINYRSWKNIT